MTAIERLVERWRTEDDVGLRPGASSDQLDDFEAKVGVSLSPSFRELYLLADGMDDCAMDDILVSMWSLARIESENGFRRNPEKRRHEIIFADWLICSFHYLLCISDDGVENVEREWEPMTDSLESFAARCLDLLESPDEYAGQAP